MQTPGALPYFRQHPLKESHKKVHFFFSLLLSYYFSSSLSSSWNKEVLGNVSSRKDATLKQINYWDNVQWLRLLSEEDRRS